MCTGLLMIGKQAGCEALRRTNQWCGLCPIFSHTRAFVSLLHTTSCRVAIGLAALIAAAEAPAHDQLDAAVGSRCGVSANDPNKGSSNGCRSLNPRFSAQEMERRCECF